MAGQLVARIDAGVWVFVIQSGSVHADQHASLLAGGSDFQIQAFGCAFAIAREFQRSRMPILAEFLGGVGAFEIAATAPLTAARCVAIFRAARIRKVLGTDVRVPELAQIGHRGARRRIQLLAAGCQTGAFDFDITHLF